MALPPPAHSAKKITLRVPPGCVVGNPKSTKGKEGSDNDSNWIHGSDSDGGPPQSWGDSDSDNDESTCQLTCTLLRPSVEHLKLSVDRYIEEFHLIDCAFILADLWRGVGKALSTVETELRRRSITDLNKEREEARVRRDWAEQLAFDVDRVRIVYSDFAGLR